jgi:hypothetical protein
MSADLAAAIRSRAALLPSRLRDLAEGVCDLLAHRALLGRRLAGGTREIDCWHINSTARWARPISHMQR